MKPYGKWDAFVIGCANAVLHLASDRCRLTIGALVQQGMTCVDRHPPLPDTTTPPEEPTPTALYQPEYPCLPDCRHWHHEALEGP